jgi:capsular exopolysaccharide synthesis family protein
VKPNVPLLFLFSVALGLVGGLSLAFGLEYMDDTVSSQAEIEERLGLPFLGLLPAIPEDIAPDPLSRDLHMHRHPNSSVAECCRAIRTNLLFMSPDKPFRTMLVSSSGPREGKSTAVISLGVTMAQSGSRVLIVDTDMRRPRLHKAFGVPNDLGVSSLVVGEGSLDAAVKSTEVANLFVLPCGPIPPNPAELLHTGAFKDLLKSVSAKFDRVILDSPPIGPLTDAVILGTQVDGVVLVLKAGETSREMVKRTARALIDVKARMFGVVLNQADLADPRYGQYYYAYQHYGQVYKESQG